MTDDQPTTLTGELTGADPVFMRPRASWVLGLLAFLATPLLAAALLAAYYAYDTSQPVVTDFRVQTQFVTDHSVLITGTMNKARDCEFIEITARTAQREVTRVDFLDLGDRQAFSRPLGPQKFGPWAVWAGAGDGITLYARHQCWPLWQTTAEIGTFVAGQQ